MTNEEIIPEASEGLRDATWAGARSLALLSTFSRSRLVVLCEMAKGASSAAAGVPSSLRQR